MEDGYTEVSMVEFRGLSSHYLATDAIQAAFRYASGSFAASPEDRVGLFSADPAGSTAAEAIVKVGDPTLHRPCDGGNWKQGVVKIPSSELPTTGGAHRLCYVNRWGDVCGKSATFILCRDMSEFPSITIQSTEDHVLIDKLREQSLPTMSFEHVDDCLALEAVGMHTSGSAGSSFQIVTEEKKVEEDTESEREEEGDETEDQFTGQQAPIAMEERSLPLKISAGGREMQNKEDKSNPSHNNTIDVYKFELRESTASVTKFPPSEKVEFVGKGIEGSEMMKDLSLSESTVMVEQINASEGWRAKQQNKELREKIRILTAKMTRMKSVQEEEKQEMESQQQENRKLRDELCLLSETVKELKEKMLEMEEQKRQTEADNSQLLKKIDQLENELAVISEHDRQLLQQIQAYETELCVLRSEKEVVEERLQHMEKRRRAKHAAMTNKERDHHHHCDKKEETPTSSKAATKQEQPKTSALKHKPPKPKLTPSIDSQHRVDKHPQPLSQPAAARPAKAQGMTGTAPAPVVSQTNGLSEDRIQEITRKLKGTESFYECPICHKQLLSRDSEYSASLHVEHCLRNYRKH